MEDAAEKQREFSVSGVLEKLGISKSGYYDWKRRDKSKTAKRKERVIEKIKEVHKKSYENYGAPKITRELRKQGEVISERTVGKYIGTMSRIRTHLIDTFFIFKTSFVIVRRFIVTMTVNPNCIVKCFDIFKYHLVCHLIINDLFSIQPLSFN